MVKTRTVSDRLRSPNFRSWSMKTSLANAFAVARLRQIQEFHLWLSNTKTPNHPYQSLPLIHKPTKQNQDPKCYTMLKYLWLQPLWNKLISSKYATIEKHRAIKRNGTAIDSAKLNRRPLERGSELTDRYQTTSFLNATTLTYALGAGITAAAGTRLALQSILAHFFRFCSFQIQNTFALNCYFLSLPPCIRNG